MHNEILARFHRHHKPLINKRLPAPEFARLLVEATNDVLTSRGIEERATVKDVALMLHAFMRIKNEGIMDPFDPSREELFRALEYAADKGIISEDACRQYSAALLTTERYDQSVDRAKRPLRDQIICSTDNSNRDKAFLDILDHSYAYWDEIDLNESMTSGVRDTAPPDLDPSEKMWLKISSYGTDALWSFLAIAMLPMTAGISIGTVIASTTASLAMECLMGDFLNWMDNELDGEGDD